MTVKFIEPGGDADFGVNTKTGGTMGLWQSVAGGSVATDFVHGGHIKSIKYRTNNTDYVITPAVIADTGTRISLYIYLNALPNATSTIFGDDGGVFLVRLTSAGVLQMTNGTTQIGSNGATLATGQWYRISLSYTITSLIVNRFELRVNGSSSISITNATLLSTGTSNLDIGNVNGNLTLDMRSSDHYIDDSSALTDPGNIWVTAKRPNANGTANNFTTRVGAGGSGYGTGHSPQVNERPLSTTNGWARTASTITEEYNIEGKSTGDIDISTATIVDYMGWVVVGATGSETGGSMILNGSSSSISWTSTNTTFTKMAGSSTYPAGTGTDIGVISGSSGFTDSLYECGIIVAYIPAVVVVTSGDFLPFM